jgi:hypothetical protein
MCCEAYIKERRTEALEKKRREKVRERRSASQII